MDAPLQGDTAGTQAPPLPISIIHPRTILPNDINHPNGTVGAAPACPPERPRSGVSIRK